MSVSLLSLSGVHAGYGTAQVLQGVDLEVDSGECVTIFGRNGVGKSTLIKAITGLVVPTQGTVRVDGREIQSDRTENIARAGVALVPQGRRIFPNLSVGENLDIAVRPGRWTIERVHELLPHLRARSQQSGAQLSGGEQQMLSIARALVSNPRIMLLDEPSEGLAPLIVDQVGDLLAALLTERMSILLVEQNVGLGMRVADRVALMDRGRLIHQMTCEEFRSRPDLARKVLGVSV